MRKEKRKKGREGREKRRYIKTRAFFYLFSFIFFLFAACTIPESEEPAEGNYDPDLHGWRTASWTPFTVTDTITGFAYGKADGITDGGGRYVAVSGTGAIAWSDNGDVWRNITIDPESAVIAGNFNAVCFGGGCFIAVGNGGIYARSTDGIRWTMAAMDGFGMDAIRGITWGNNWFVAVGDSAKIACSSNGGFNWEPKMVPDNFRDHDGNAMALNAVAYESSNNRFYVVGNYGNIGWVNGNPIIGWNGLIWSKDNPDGTWGHYRLALPEPYPNFIPNLSGVTIGYINNFPVIGFVHNRRDGDYIENRVFIGFHHDILNFYEDDDKWRFLCDPFMFDGFNMNVLAWGGDYFVTAGNNAMIGYLPNSIERYWHAITFPEFARWEITALAACNGRFFIGNIGGKIGYSK